MADGHMRMRHQGQYLLCTNSMLSHRASLTPDRPTSAQKARLESSLCQSRPCLSTLARQRAIQRAGTNLPQLGTVLRPYMAKPPLKLAEQASQPAACHLLVPPRCGSYSSEDTAALSRARTMRMVLGSAQRQCRYIGTRHACVECPDQLMHAPCWVSGTARMQHWCRCWSLHAQLCVPKPSTPRPCSWWGARA